MSAIPGPRAPRPRLGIVGGGQLARMTAESADALGVDVAVLAQPGDDATRGQVTDRTVVERLGPAVLQAFARCCDVVTFDHEKVRPGDVAALERAGHVVRPGLVAFTMAADKSVQRRRLDALGLPVPEFLVTDDAGAARRFAEAHGGRAVVKAARGGYDGRGVVRADRPSAAAAAAATMLRRRGTEVVVEPWLAIERELAVLVARRPGGQLVTYPVVETRQDETAICREVVAPAAIDARTAEDARRLAADVAAAVDAVGILAVELFVVDGTVVVNELAARPHNTGHLTIEACATSQFANHVRGVLDLPLGPTDLVVPAAAMANVIARGTTDPAAVDVERLVGPGGDPVVVHGYGKQARPGRKIGHVTALATDRDAARRRAVAVARGIEAATRPPAPAPAPRPAPTPAALAS
ncbi:MAG: 5-(carboxyamino)imidazole ribonucleotide synthase [Acidimicrobiales bacterium]|nr:5-(carboxyamino)imidazole ribonucleotide synthase [Acidimicrobiales bacterium]